MEELQLSKWIVFVQSGSCQIEGIAACLLRRVGTYEDSKYLRIILTSTARSDAEDIATIGHELQHALEVVRDGAVVRGSDIRDLYRRIGYVAKRVREGEVYETHAAVEARETVLRHLGAVQAATVNESDRPAVGSVPYRPCCRCGEVVGLRTTTPDLEATTSTRAGMLIRSCSNRE